MPGVLVFGAIADGQLLGASLEVAAAGQELARAMGTRLFGGLIASDCAAAAQLLAAAGVTELFVADNARHVPYVADFHIAAAEAIIRRCAPAVVLFPQTAETSEWVPVLAARLEAAMATACTRLAFDGERVVVTRPVCGGAVQGEYVFNRPLQIATMSPGACAPIALSDACPISPVAVPDLQPRVTVVEEVADEASAGPRLKSARVVVSGGLGVGGREDWRLIDEAAAALGAAIGATRAVVELGWVPSSQQVGFSGQKISPELYIAIGISGAVHHLAGIAGAKTIVAINKDPDAAIFRAARFGVVGDVKEVVPAFVERVKELRANQA
jgi:electron transfer flavoprotein alpha subunit